MVIELTQKQVSQLFKEGMKLEQVKTQTYNLEEKIYKTKNEKKVIHYIGKTNSFKLEYWAVTI